ncbi:hypothetical protein [Streptomyces gilvosporeus]|uniref:Uncharacterized protein n=1 Tax=Streptomyces gilvosporeus TaxID=553510 RepID=A0A1V0TSU5_9ACTN|nr:hypothetical protein [Streptomyces gilvosporeus]ARF55961.1 hypothetical protein B1H19_18805 [Streptomyces gilvosporeus]
MARDYDSQLLESVSVRRRRLRDALMFGGQRTRRSLDESFGKVFGGIALAAVVCAGCVGWSFVAGKMAGGATPPGVSPSGPSGSTSPTGPVGSGSPAGLNGGNAGAGAAW